MPYTSPRPRLRPLNLARLETETETVLHKVFMPVTSSMVKVYIRDRVRDRDLENGLYESETETETLESRDTRDETRVSSVSGSYPFIANESNTAIMDSAFEPKSQYKVENQTHLLPIIKQHENLVCCANVSPN